MRIPKSGRMCENPLGPTKQEIARILDTPKLRQGFEGMPSENPNVE